MPNSKLEHVPAALKHVADASAWVGVLTSWVLAITPILQGGVIILALIWGYFRIQDIRLAIHLKKLKIRRHEDQ